MGSKIQVVLVNLISKDYLARYQAPLAVGVLSAYFRSVFPDIAINIIDMQDVFEKQSNDEGTIEDIFEKTVKTVIASLTAACFSGKTIVGLSVKWSTQEIAGRIISQARKETLDSRPLFVIGNIGSTHGYRELLIQDAFSDVVAVIGEAKSL